MSSDLFFFFSLFFFLKLKQLNQTVKRKMLYKNKMTSGLFTLSKDLLILSLQLSPMVGLSSSRNYLSQQRNLLLLKLTLYFFEHENVCTWLFSEVVVSGLERAEMAVLRGTKDNQLWAESQNFYIPV